MQIHLTAAAQAQLLGAMSEAAKTAEDIAAADQLHADVTTAAATQAKVNAFFLQVWNAILIIAGSLITVVLPIL